MNEIAEFIDKGIYDKPLNEPTPLEDKKKLVQEVREEFWDDLSFRGVSLITFNLAWDLSEEINGADEALNPIFLHTVLTYIDILEKFVKERTNEV